MELYDIITHIKRTTHWTNESRIVGEACEEYVKQTINCIRCNNKLQKYKINEKSKDFICIGCNQKYQIKSKSSTDKQVNNIKQSNLFKTIGGEYSTTLNSISENIDYLIILYEKKSYKIKAILYKKYETIDGNCIISRKPLSLTAKRAGWQGCNILFNDIHFMFIN